MDGQLEARRSNDLDAMEAANAEVEVAEYQCSLLGGFLLCLGIEKSTGHLRKALSELYGLPGQVAFDQAKRLNERLNHALNTIDSLKARIEKLESPASEKVKRERNK